MEEEQHPGRGRSKCKGPVAAAGLFEEQQGGKAGCSKVRKGEGEEDELGQVGGGMAAPGLGALERMVDFSTVRF